MKNKPVKRGAIIGLILCFIIPNCFSTLGVTIKEFSSETTRLEQVLISHSNTEIHYLTKEYYFTEPKIQEHGNYMCVYVDESDLNNICDGLPVIPINLTTIELPFGTEILTINYTLSPPQNLSLTKKLPYGIYAPDTTMNENVYGSSDLYPDDWVSIHTGGGLSHGEHITFLTIRVHPVRYLPVNDQLHYITSIAVNITYQSPIQPILNVNTYYDLLILTPSLFTDVLQPLIEHKNQIGVKTKLVTLEEVYEHMFWEGRDTQEKIKYFIKHAIENWGISYVLLVGGIKDQTDTWHLPVRYSHVVPPDEQEFAEQAFISDLYYADIYTSKGDFSSWDSNNNNIFAEWNEVSKDEMDIYPDVYLGRLACRNVRDVNTMVNKIINYEKECDDSWFKNIVLVGGDSYNDINHFVEGELANQEALNHLPGFRKVAVWASEQDISKKSVNTAMNSGCGFAYFCGHGSPTAWNTHFPPNGTDSCSGYKIFDMSYLRNHKKLPIVVVGGCNNAQFNVTFRNFIRGLKEEGLLYFIWGENHGSFWYGDWAPKCWGWRLTSKIGGGAIATIANTGLGTHGMEDTDYNTIADYLEVLDGWLEIRFFQLYGEEHVGILGATHGETLTGYLHRFLGANEKMDVKMVQEWELFGDPSLRIGGCK